jgi:ABC-type multidrug transport system permease subunit
VVENIGLLRALSASSTGVVVPVISLMATVKFALLLVAAGVLVASLLMRLLARRRRVSDPGAG